MFYAHLITCIYSFASNSCLVADFKILAFQNPDLKILTAFKILAFQNPQFKILTSGLAGKKLHGHIFSDIKMQRSND